MDTCRSLGLLFRQARKEKNMTQEQVGRLIGMGANGYGKLELGINQIPTDLVVPCAVSLAFLSSMLCT